MGDLSGSPGCIWLIWNDKWKRPFKCPKDGCDKCYKRPDHLKRHLLRHDEMPKLCPWPGCIMVCSNQCSFRRHLQRHYRKGDLQRGNLNEKVLKCSDPDCNAVFAYPCRLESHCSIVHGLHCAEFFCGEPGCGKAFDSAKLLQEHISQSHKTIICHICGFSILRRNSKRHVEAHDPNRVKQRLFCPVDNCSHSYSNSFNLSVHMKVRHLGMKGYQCAFDNCNKGFGYKHVRDMHERTKMHFYVQGDFEEEDLKFQARCRGGRKPVTLQSVEDLFRKRVMCDRNEQEAACGG
ncbi:hypothetical protein KP509_10G034100 [Ceratopteris richardii]|uniref:C2H2-type domain-containing protein n=1 Tax=Ceratopteris richardii TaxID=49495 RepID=A0A8T2U0R8_CERRI|nr:hypothetical protein KP509_10G034100 [Ceratopteris richardii]